MNFITQFGEMDETATFLNLNSLCILFCRIRVAAAAAASSMARSPSIRRLTIQKGAVSDLWFSCLPYLLNAGHIIFYYYSAEKKVIFFGSLV